MRKNFAKYEDLQELFADIGKKKLSVSDTMPTAGAAYEDICILYIGPTDANYTKGYVYECEEVTPSTDPKTYSWNAKINVDVDLSKYKTIFPGTKDEWDALTQAQQDQYDYCFFDDDESDYYAVSNEVAKGNMHSVTSNAVAENIQDMNNVYGSKNLCPTFMSGTIAGVIYTVNLDGSITAVGTSNATTAFMNTTEAYLPNGEYIMSAGADASTDLRFVVEIIKDGTPKYYEVDSANKEVSFTVDDPDGLDIYVRTNGGSVSINGTLYPMIRCASISDNTYVSYAKTNRQLTEDSVDWNNFSKLGAVNYCKNNIETHTFTDDTTTFTCTVNEDKSVTISAPSYPVTFQKYCVLEVSGTFSEEDCKDLVGKSVKLTGCPSGGSASKYTLYAYRIGSADGSTGSLSDFGDGAEFTWLNNGSANKPSISIRFYTGCVLTKALTFKPMIALPSYNGPYVPYAKSNRQLTEEIEHTYALIDIVTLTYTPTENETLSSRLNKLYELITNYETSMPSNHRIKVTNIRVGSIQLLNTYSGVFSTTMTIPYMYFVGSSFDSNKLTQRYAYITEANSKYILNEINISTGINTITDNTNVLSTSETSVRFEVYRRNF